MQSHICRVCLTPIDQHAGKWVCASCGTEAASADALCCCGAFLVSGDRQLPPGQRPHSARPGRISLALPGLRAGQWPGPETGRSGADRALLRALPAAITADYSRVAVRQLLQPATRARDRPEQEGHRADRAGAPAAAAALPPAGRWPTVADRDRCRRRRRGRSDRRTSGARTARADRAGGGLMNRIECRIADYRKRADQRRLVRPPDHSTHPRYRGHDDAWKRAHGWLGCSKDDARATAQRLYPTAALGLKKDLALAEALSAPSAGGSKCSNRPH